MKVELINKENEIDIINKLYLACKTCYVQDITYENVKETDIFKKIKTINKCFNSKHLSIFEHVNFTFSLKNIPLFTLTQLNRHRHMSTTQMSRRYVDVTFYDININDIENFNLLDNNIFFIPDKIKNILKEDEHCYDIFVDYFHSLYNLYDSLLNYGIKKEDARSFLPVSTYSNEIITLNLRELIHICSLRLCNKAQLNIRELLNEIKLIINDNYPHIGCFLQPKCMLDDKCTEERPCGYYEKIIREMCNECR